MLFRWLLNLVLNLFHFSLYKNILCEGQLGIFELVQLFSILFFVPYHLHFITAYVSMERRRSCFVFICFSYFFKNGLDGSRVTRWDGNSLHSTQLQRVKFITRLIELLCLVLLPNRNVRIKFVWPGNLIAKSQRLTQGHSKKISREQLDLKIILHLDSGAQQFSNRTFSLLTQMYPAFFGEFWRCFS